MANTHSLDLELSSSQYAKVTDAAQTGLDVTGNITIEFWMKLEQLPSAAGTVMVLVSKALTTGSQVSYQCFLEVSDNKLYMDWCDDGSNAGAHYTRFHMDLAFDSSDISVWRHIAISCTVATPTVAFYKDTVSKSGTADFSNATSIFNGTADFMIGAKIQLGSPALFFDGKLDDVRVWNTARTGTQISTNYSQELAGSESNLVGYWKFNNNYNDSTSNGNNLTASGSPVFSADVFFTGADSPWSERQPVGNTNKPWVAAASDHDGSNLLLGSGNDIGRLHSSSDYGVIWTERQPAGNIDKNWYALSSNIDGSRLVAGASPGRLYTSCDFGSTWVERQPKGNNDGNWIKAASDHDGSNIIIADSGGRIWTSSNYGIDWTERRPKGDVNVNWYGVGSNDDGSRLIVAEQGGRVWTSSDSGGTWTERRPAGDVDKNWRLVASNSSGSALMVGVYNSGRLYTSSDYGVNWTERQPAGATDTWWIRGVISSNGNRLIACIYNNNLGTFYLSDNGGSNWTEQTPSGSANRGWAALGISLDGTRIIVGSFNDTPNGGSPGRVYTAQISV